MTRAFRVAILTAAIVGGVGVPLLPANAAGTGSVSGVAFEDTNRNGVQDAGEAPRSGDGIYLLSGDGQTFVANTTTDDLGQYTFSGLASGAYTVQYAGASWYAIRDSRVPTTTGSIRPARTIDVSGAARADFGWRPLSVSKTLGAPVSAYRGAEGLAVESYNDAVTARTVYDTLAASGAIGAEASSITVRFGYGSTDITNSSWQKLETGYGNYSSTSYSTYASWLDEGDATLFHEYGHAWSGYFAAVVQQDPQLSGYVQARGLTGDSRLDSDYGWSRQELVAEDFRQLFGTSTAKARAQANPDLPPAGAVPGLFNYLSQTFRTAAATTQPTPSTSATPLTVSAPTVTAVKTKTSFSWEASEAAQVTLTVTDAGGKLVRTLLSSVARPSGSSSAIWDRTDSAGRKVKAGTYSVNISLTTSDGRSASQHSTFSI